MAWVPRRLMLLLAGSALLLAPLLAVQLSAGAGRAHACLCAPPTLDEAFERASAVFLGRIAGVSGEWDDIIEIEVDTVWKGSLARTAVVHRPRECAHPGFTLGRDYVVFARSYEESLAVFLCSGTTVVDDGEYAEVLLRELGKGQAPQASLPGDRLLALSMLLLVTMAAAVILWLAAWHLNRSSRR